MDSSSPNLLSYIRFGQTWSETKTPQIVLESFCVHSPAHASLLPLGRPFLLALLFFLGICLRSRWSPRFPLHAFALILLSLAKVRLSPILILSSLRDLVLWTDGSVPLHFGRRGSGVLANCFLCGTKVTLSFSAGPVCPSFSAEACVILHKIAGLGSTNKSADSLLFFYLTRVLSSLPCPLLHHFSYLKLCGRSGRNCLVSPSVLSDYDGSPDICFSRRMTWLTSWADGKRNFHPLQSLVVSLLSLVSTVLFFRSGGVLSQQNSLTHRFPQFQPRNL